MLSSSLLPLHLHMPHHELGPAARSFSLSEKCVTVIQDLRLTDAFVPSVLSFKRV